MGRRLASFGRRNLNPDVLPWEDYLHSSYKHFT
jgi:hypothetical protein